VSLFHRSSAADWGLVSLTAASGTGTPPSAAVRLQRRGGRAQEAAATGDGPVDAVFKCIDRITGVSAKLRSLQITSVSAGEDAQGEATVDVESDGRRFRGRAVNTDIVVASAQAYLEVVNRIAAGRLPRRSPVLPEMTCGAV